MENRVLSKIIKMKNNKLTRKPKENKKKENIFLSTITNIDYKVSCKSSDTSKNKNNVIESVNYYTIEKKSSEYKGSNGNDLLLTIDCNGGKINFENTEKDEIKKFNLYYCDNSCSSSSNGHCSCGNRNLLWSH